MSAQSPPWPPPIQTMTMRLSSNTTYFRSPLTGQTQIAVRGVGVWQFDVSTQLLDDVRLGEYQAFLEMCQEQGLTFYWNEYPKALPILYPQGYAGGAAWGTPLVNGASQTGRALVCDGFLPSATVSAGDCIAFDNAVYREMHRCTATTTANGSGQMTIPINPAIRRSPADNAQVLLDGHNTDPALRMACEVILVDGNQAAWAMSGFQMQSSFKLVEMPR